MKREMLLLLATAAVAVAQDVRSPSVGMLGRLGDVVLPGERLEAAPLTSAAPIVLRVVAVSPHGEGAFRYDLEFQGLEPGRHDLTRYLRRASDGAPVALPPLEVEVLDPLITGKEEPLVLPPPTAPRVGGYRRLLVVAGVVWLAGLVALATVGRRRRAPATSGGARGVTPRERLAALLADARAGELSTERRAEVERLVIDAWRKRLDVEYLAPAARSEAAGGDEEGPRRGGASASAEAAQGRPRERGVADALARLRADPAAADALARLEAWLHLPPERRTPLGPGELERLAPAEPA